MFGNNPIPAGKINLEIGDWVKPGDVVVVVLDDSRLPGFSLRRFISNGPRYKIYGRYQDNPRSA